MSNHQSKNPDGWAEFIGKNKLHPTHWKETIIPLREDKKCNHFFEFQDIARCKNCGMGLYGVIQIKDGRPIV